VNTIQN